MGNPGLWNVRDQIFGYLDHETLENCRKVSVFWNESLKPFERISLINILNMFGDTISKYHRDVKMDTEDEVLKIISGWNKAVNKYGANSSIEDLREVKNSLEPLLGEVMMLLGWNHPVEEALHWACWEGQTEAVKLMLNFSQENCDLTAFHVAC